MLIAFGLIYGTLVLAMWTSWAWSIINDNEGSVFYPLMFMIVTIALYVIIN